MTQFDADDKAAIRNTLHVLLQRQCSELQVREALSTADGYDKALWQQLADMGLLGLLIDAQYGGFAADLDLLVEAAEEMGAHLLSGPYLSTAVWAVKLLQAGSNEVLKEKLLPKIASGDCTIAVAATGTKGLWTSDDVCVKAQQAASDDHWLLNGQASFVLHGHCADYLLVLADAQSNKSTKNKEKMVFLVKPNDQTVDITRLPANDPSLRLSKIRFNNCAANLLDGVGEPAIDEAMSYVRLALAAEQSGGSRRIFDITMDYLRTRHQFGRPIGSYQALKHIAADLLIAVESSTTVVHSAAKAYTHRSETANTLHYLAAFTCADTYHEVSAQAIQLHGGIAYTKEHCAHLYWRRARSGLHLFGSPDAHRESYLQCWEESLRT